VKRLRCSTRIARGVEPAVGEGVLRREAGDGEDKGEREERSMDGHGSRVVERLDYLSRDPSSSKRAAYIRRANKP